MKLLLLLSLLVISCQKKTEQLNSSTTQTSNIVANDFSDLEKLEKKDDESCDTEEDLEKKIMEEAKKKHEQAYKLKGGDAENST
jgi:hypothetical protein